MAVSTVGVVGSGPGYGQNLWRESHLEWPRGGSQGRVRGPKVGPRSASLWYKIDQPTNNEAACLAIATLGAESLYLGTDKSGDTPELFVGGSSETTGTFPCSGFDWHHFGYVTNGLWHRLYLDGSLILHFRDVCSQGIFDRICLFSSTAAAQLCGSLASVKLWETELTTAQLIAEGRAGGSVVNPTGIFGFWPLTSPADLLDHSGNGRDMSPSSPFLAVCPAPSMSGLTLKTPNLPQEQPSGGGPPVPAFPPYSPPYQSPLQPPAMTSSDTVSGASGTPLSFPVTGTNTNRFSATSLPPGLSINSSTGLISGTPTSQGVFESIVTLSGPAGEQPYLVTFFVEA